MIPSLLSYENHKKRKIFIFHTMKMLFVHTWKTKPNKQEATTVLGPGVDSAGGKRGKEQIICFGPICEEI